MQPAGTAALTGKLGFMGFGNMGGAILRGALGAGAISADRVFAYDIDPAKRAEAEATGAAVVSSPEELARKADTLILAVKPQSMAEALESLKPVFDAKALVISIAAGISISYIQARLGKETRVVRVMPNTPCLVGKGACGYCLGDRATPKDALRPQLRP